MTQQIRNKVIIVVSKIDIAGINMLNFILRQKTFKQMEPEIPNSWPTGDYEYYQDEKISILVIPGSQIFTDHFKVGLEADLLIFASKHSSSAGQKALLVHTTGIWQKEGGHGGRDHELAYVPSNLLNFAYKLIKKYQEQRDLPYWTGIECTHHGPSSLDIPIAFFEAGGTVDEWNDADACNLIAQVILETIDHFLQSKIPNYPAFIGLGGNHYCSSFIKLLDENEFGLGHILPKYAIPDLPVEMLEQAYIKTLADQKFFLLDKKGMRAKDRDRFIEFIEENEWNWKFT